MENSKLPYDYIKEQIIRMNKNALSNNYTFRPDNKGLMEFMLNC